MRAARLRLNCFIDACRLATSRSRLMAHTPPSGVHLLLTVGTLYEYRLSVYEQLCVLDFNLANPTFHRYCLHFLVVLHHSCKEV